jgi:Right handed beta helix region
MKTLICVTMCLVSLATPFARAATLKVNDSSDTGGKADGRLSLREALLLANGDASMKTCVGLGETRQVSGNVRWVTSVVCPFQGLWDLVGPLSAMGSGQVDTIVLDPALGNLFPTHELNWLEAGDTLEGNNRAVVGSLAGQANGLVVVGVSSNHRVVSGGLIRNLVIAGFSGDGLLISGVERLRLQGLSINKNGRHGIEFVNDKLISESNTVGGTSAGQGNLIFENGADGILMTGDPIGGGSNTIVGNVIGLDSPNSTSRKGNKGYGIHIVNSGGNTIGGSQPGAANLICANSVDGVKIEGAISTFNAVQGNLIGTNAAGAPRLGNVWSAVALVADANNNTISSNTVAGGLYGLFIGGTDKVAFNSVLSNFIGTDPMLHAGLGSSSAAVIVAGDAHDNTIGAPGKGNRIASSAGVGVDIDHATNNTVAANAIGFADTTRGLPNALGIQLRGGSTKNTVRGNTIGFNLGEGIFVTGAGTSDSVFDGNFIGVDPLGVSLGNGGAGMLLDTSTGPSVVTNASMAFNQGAGVAVAAGSFGNTFVFTTVHDNNGPGVDLNFDGIGCSGDSGGNRCIPPPRFGGTMPGGVWGTASSSAQIHLYVPATNLGGVGGGLQLLTTADAGSTGSWQATLPCTPGTIVVVNATQTDTTTTNNGTSEFTTAFKYTCR